MQNVWKQEWLLRSLQISSSADLRCRISFLSLSQLPGKQKHFLERMTCDEEIEFSYLWSRNECSVALKLVSEFGCIFFPDSLFYKQKDLQTIRYDLSMRVGKNWHFSLNTSATTPVFPMIHCNLQDSTLQSNLFTGSFLTPLKMTITAGIKLTIRELGSLYLGPCSLKLVYILDQQVFAIMNVDQYQGVAPGERWYDEYGLCSSFDLTRNLTPSLNWQCHLDAFLAGNKSVDLLFKNLFSWKAGKWMNANLQTRIVYDSDRISVFQLENLLSIGLMIRFTR